ncbi:MAG: VOC family protein [Actinomycetota bacterium]
MSDASPPRGITHVSLSVSDLEQSLDFYHRILNLPILVPPFDGEVFDGRQVMLTAGRIALCLQAHTANEGEAFEPTRTGLDHFALRVESRSELEQWSIRLDREGIPHSEIKPAGAFGQMIELRDPDGIQLELHTLEQ